MERTKYADIQLVYSSEKFNCNRVKRLKNATSKQMGKAMAQLMSKGYKIVRVMVNGMLLEDYVEYYELA